MSKILRDVFRARASRSMEIIRICLCANVFLSSLAQFTHFLSSMNKYTVVKLSSLHSCMQANKILWREQQSHWKWLVRIRFCFYYNIISLSREWLEVVLLFFLPQEVRICKNLKITKNEFHLSSVTSSVELSSGDRCNLCATLIWIADYTWERDSVQGQLLINLPNGIDEVDVSICTLKCAWRLMTPFPWSHISLRERRINICWICFSNHNHIKKCFVQKK